MIRGDLTLGALVAVIAAHEKLYSPWKELLTYYQLLWDSQIKFEQVVAQFDPPGMRDEALQSADPEQPFDARGELRVSNLNLVGDDGETILDNVGFAVGLPSRIAIVGPAGSGKEELTLVLANLLEPSAGRILIADQDVQRLAEAVTGRQITYVGYPAQLFSGTHRRQPVLRAQAPAGARARARGRAAPRSTSASATRPSARATRPTTARPTGSTTRRSACRVPRISPRSRSRR